MNRADEPETVGVRNTSRLETCDSSVLGLGVYCKTDNRWVKNNCIGYNLLCALFNIDCVDSYGVKFNTDDQQVCSDDFWLHAGCYDGQTRCHGLNRGQCVENIHKCDGVVGNCTDGSDEVCPNGNIN